MKLDLAGIKRSTYFKRIDNGGRTRYVPAPDYRVVVVTGSRKILEEIEVPENEKYFYVDCGSYSNRYFATTKIEFEVFELRRVQ